MNIIFKLSAFAAIGAVLVLALLQPFGIDKLEENRLLFFLFETVIVFSASCISLLLANKLFNLPLSNFECRKDLYKSLLIYHFVNIPILSAMLLTYHSWFYCNSMTAAWYCTNGTFSFINYLYLNLQVLFVSFFIFVLQAYMLRNNQLLQELDEMRTINTLLEERQKQTEDKNAKKDEAVAKCQLLGNTRNAMLEVVPNDIVYIESMANYADVCYLEDGVTTHKTLRTTMKQLQDTLSDVDFIVSPHRAFLVNLNFVVAVAGQSSVGYHLQMFGMDKEIPVSRANTKVIKERLSV